MKQVKKNNEYAFSKALARVELGTEPVMPNVGVIGADGKPKMQVSRDLVTYQMRKTRDGADGLTTDEIRVNGWQRHHEHQPVHAFLPAFQAR